MTFQLLCFYHMDTFGSYSTGSSVSWYIFRTFSEYECVKNMLCFSNISVRQLPLPCVPFKAVTRSVPTAESLILNPAGTQGTAFGNFLP